MISCFNALLLPELRALTQKDISSPFVEGMKTKKAKMKVSWSFDIGIAEGGARTHDLEVVSND